MRVVSTDNIGIDVGPVISDEAHNNLAQYIKIMRASGCAFEQIDHGDAINNGTFIRPTLIEISSVNSLK
ncbi:hypothetical protein [Bartonella tamiae]|uniref:Uncharacterized protein n=1 Tax=Bartonella tamiae Th239 TaxID=1094558 RepID=J0R1L1_9HYPH|nr:hypothetical protein [Bartonella tamiae]EJF89409.1 hypothetical protein ME5_01960 [Bartonella tamiae Th239]EJF92726.1 hypothetical protein MEG_01896 [Bartonella tamiae Th307]